ncbi:MAG: hypothetical protein AAF902_02075 [Chloroflexota bacterium]
MTKKKVSPVFEAVREGMYPEGKFTLPAVDRFTEKHWREFDLISERHRLSDEDADGNEIKHKAHDIVRMSAKVACDFINKFGDWDFEEMSLANFKAAFKSPDDMPTQFMYWVAGQFLHYTGRVKDPNAMPPR